MLGPERWAFLFFSAVLLAVFCYVVVPPFIVGLITNFLLDVRDYPKMAEVRQQYLQEPYPASTMVQVSGFLHPGLLVEIEGIAVAV